MTMIPTIDRIKDTTIMRMIRKLAGVTDEAIGKNAESVEQTFDEENRILATTLKTVDGTEITGSVYVPGGGDGGDIVVDKIDYYDDVETIFNAIRNKYASGTYECNLRVIGRRTVKNVTTDVVITATQMVINESTNVKHVSFLGNGLTTTIPVLGIDLKRVNIDGSITYEIGATLYVDFDGDYEWVDTDIDNTQKIEIEGYIIKGIKGAAIQPYTATNGITIDDENAVIGTDGSVVRAIETGTYYPDDPTNRAIAINYGNPQATGEWPTATAYIGCRDGLKVAMDDSGKPYINVDTDKIATKELAQKAYTSAYVKDNTMTFEKGNGDTDTIELPTGGSYVAGNGITISDNEIAVDTSTIATTAVTTELASGISTNRNLINGTFDDVNISGSTLVFDKVNGEQKEIEIPSGSGSGEWISVSSLSDIDTSKFTAGTQILIGSNIANSSTGVMLERGIFTVGYGAVGSFDGWVVIKSGTSYLHYKAYYITIRDSAIEIVYYKSLGEYTSSSITITPDIFNDVYIKY